MADTKYTMIGMSSAGKTCYITGMYMKMAVGMDGFTLVTDDKTRTKLERDIQTLRCPTGQDRFPMATRNHEDATVSYEFRLNYDLKKIISFEMLDYAGGSLADRGSVYSQVKQSIAESTALYVIIDGTLFCSDDREERKENVYYDCAMYITPIIQDFADSHEGQLPPIVFVITKSDLCKRYVTGEEIVSVLKSLFSPAFADGTTSYIAAVSLGDTISDDGYKGKFRPVNIHIPFFIGSYHEYYNRCVILKNDIEDANWQLKKTIESKNAAAQREGNKWRIFRDDGYIERCRSAAKSAEKGIQSNRDLFDTTKELLIKFGTRLEVESPNFKCFINGIEQSSFKSFKL